MTPLYIESVSNPKVKIWSTLKTRKGRQSQGIFLAEGPHLVEEALQSSTRVTAVLIDVGSDHNWENIINVADNGHIAIFNLSPQAFAAVSDTVSPQGILALVGLPEAAANQAITAKYPRQSLVLDGVQDPGNVGTLLRTAEAFGVSEVCCGSQAADPFSPKVVRASMGGVFRLSLPVTSSTAYVAGWRATWPGGQVVVGDLASTLPCHSCDFTRPSLIVIGSEAHGPADELLTMADTKVRIPMESPVDSLNAAVAGSIVLYESYRQQQVGFDV